MDKITQILENVVRCKYFEAGVHIKNPIKNPCQDGLGRTTSAADRNVIEAQLSYVGVHREIIELVYNTTPVVIFRGN